MKEIKFRAWDKKENKMYLKVSAVYPLSNSKDITCRINDVATDKPIFGAVLMQYTGLKDKNGVEIYEGDIVSLDIFNPLYNAFFTHNSVVVFQDGMFKVEKWGCSLKDALEREDLENGVEVVGNIYENKFFGI